MMSIVCWCLALLPFILFIVFVLWLEWEGQR
jgi:hypothetical protein